MNAHYEVKKHNYFGICTTIEGNVEGIVPLHMYVILRTLQRFHYMIGFLRG